MGLFDKFRTADIMGVRQYIEEGNHLFLCGAIKHGNTKNPTKAQNIENFIAEFTTVRTTPLKPDQADKLSEHMSCSLVETSAQMGYEGNVVSFIAGVLGMTPTEFQKDPESEGMLKAIIGESQILASMLVWCSAQKVNTKKTASTGQQYTAKSWKPVPAREYAQYGYEPPLGTYDPDGYFAELEASEKGAAA